MDHPLSERVEDLRRRKQEALTPGSERSIERQYSRGKMLARERIDYFLDEGSFHELDGLARSRNAAATERPYTDGVITGWGTVDGRQVFAFAQRELRNDDQANWIAGIGARWTLFTSLDRGALDAASAAQVEQARHTDAQARDDIALLVERQWRAVEQARQAYQGMAASVALAEEIVHLRSVGLREGTSTPLERIEADANLAKVQTERAQAAYDYVTALAGLYEACGQPEQLVQAAARADIRISP